MYPHSYHIEQWHNDNKFRMDTYGKFMFNKQEHSCESDTKPHTNHEFRIRESSAPSKQSKDQQEGKQERKENEDQTSKTEHKDNTITKNRSS